MADFTALKTAIQNAIKQNGNEEITGNLLQEVLLAIVTTLGDGSINDLITALGSEATTRQQGDSTLQGGINTAMQAINAINNAIGNGCVYAGIATPSTTPAAGKVFYLALTAGTYTNFNGLEVSQGINILKNNGSTWLLDSFLGIDDAPAPSSQKLVKSGGVFDEVMKNGSAFDLSAYNGGATYADLNAALTALNALPAAYKRGGMSMKFVLSSDNKYVQFRLMSDSFNTTPANWQGVDDEPTAGSDNVVKSGGVFKGQDNLERNKIQQSFMKDYAFGISDEEGNNLLEIDEKGDIETKTFKTTETPKTNFSEKELVITDEAGNNIAEFVGGGIKTKSFDSTKIENVFPVGILQKPTSEIPIYITCNDIMRTNKWGIGIRNKSVSIYLDHFFHTDKEISLFFDNKSPYYPICQEIFGNVGTNGKWNNDQTKYEQIINLQVGEEILAFKVRSILNSETKNIFPKVLQIGDSVTEGWFAKYPQVDGAPVQSWSWAKYYFQKDAEQYGSLYKSIFLGNRNKSQFNYNGVSGVGYACGIGGKTAKWMVTNTDSPFYTANGFSLQSYLNKYKTLEDDGVTRLVAGSTAGTEVTDVMAWDLCTPNIVVIQLGTNDVLSEWKTYIPQIVNSIKTEFPNMKIILSVLDGCTCNYPSLYQNYQGIFFDNYNNDHTKLMEAYCYAIDNWQDESNDIYVLYAGMVMPMPMTCNVRELEGMFDDENKRYVGVDSVERVPHPSRYAHQEIGYLLYSAIKWILTN